VGLTLPDGPTEVVTAAGIGFSKIVNGPTIPASVSEIVVTKTQDDIVLHRVRDVSTQTGPTTVVTATPKWIELDSGLALPTESITLNFVKTD
jgi:hypothetical protein